MKTTACEYANDGARITQPGKFEGEPIFAPYFWDLALNGMADQDDGETFTFRFAFATTDCDIAFRKELQQWLGRRHGFSMKEDSQGFVHCL